MYERVIENKARRERNRWREVKGGGVREKGRESICEEIPEGDRLEIKEEQMKTNGQMETLVVD